MRTAFINAEKIITADTNGRNIKKGKSQNEIGLLDSHFVLAENERIADILPNTALSKTSFDKTVDLAGRILLPGLTECHTHLMFAGNRCDEFFMKLDHASYEEIAAAGGGIKSTMRATRIADEDELVQLSLPRINNFISQGVTNIEIKSGYGLDFENEVKMLKAIKRLKSLSPAGITASFLGAHTVPPEFKNDRSEYVRLIIDKMIPFISENELADFIDVFCESSAFTADETDDIFTAGSKSGLKIRVHTEQFNCIGGLETALRHNAVSVDHLEMLEDTQVSGLAQSRAVSVLLPGVSFSLKYNYAPARKIIDAGGSVALSTDFNPGSSHILNLHFIMQLAAMNMGMTAEEIISAVTINAAAALGLSDETGSIEIGKKADFAVFETNDIKNIIYSIGNNLNSMTIKGGRIIYTKKEIEII